jgi:YesN/AraC family two-component response regulator
MNEKLLLVDDEVDFLDVLSEFLMDEGYKVSTARDAKEALGLLSKETFGLLLSDINMPGMKGFELIKEAGRLYPSLKSALITAYDVRDYLYMAKHYNIGNIITKTTPFNFEEVRLLVKNILSEDVFGLDHYMHGPTKRTMVRCTNEIEGVIQKIVADMPDVRHKRKFRQVLNEIIINAAYYGAKSERGDRKELWPLVVNLAPDEEILIEWGTDEEKAGVAVCDQKGVLKKEEVLYWLERNATKGDDGMSIGLLDEHGKGLFISRETIDRFIVNIKRGQKTEIVMLNYGEGLYDGYRPLWIQEM